MKLESGSTLGRYRILESREDSEGPSYVALDTRRDRRVLLRELPASIAGDPAGLERIAVESRRLGELDHPAIVAPLSIERRVDRAFLATPLLEGTSLGERLAGGALAPRDLETLALSLAEIFSAAHRAGIVHGSLGPDDVVLDADDGSVRVRFGLPAPDRNRNYLTPEHVAGHPIDARSDLFALGSLVHHAASGEWPFAGSSGMDRALAVQRATLDRPRGVAERMWRPIGRCLEKSPARRYANAIDLAQALRAEPTRAPAPVYTSAIERPRRGGRIVATVVGITAIVGLVAFFALDWRSNESSAAPPVERPAEVDPSAPTRLAVAPFVGDEIGLAFELRDRLATLDALEVLPAEIELTAPPVVRLEGESGADGLRLRLRDGTDTVLWEAGFDPPSVAAIASAVVEAIGVEVAGLQRVALERDSSLSPRLARMLAIARRAESDADALEALQAALELDPGSAEVHGRIALIDAVAAERERDEARRERAVLGARRAISLDPADVSANVALGVALLAVERGEARQRLERALAIEPSHAVAHHRLGMLELREGDLDAAADHWTRAARLDPALMRAQGDRIYLDVLAGRYERAIREGERLLAEPELAAAGQRAIGAAHAAAGRHEQAEAALRAAVELEPWNESVVLELFDAMVELDSDTRLEQAARWYARRFPRLRLAEVITRYVDARVSLRRGESRRALELLDGLEGEVLGDPLVDWRFGAVAARAESTLGRQEAAVARLRATLERFPAWQEGRLRLADALVAAERPGQAAVEYRAFLALRAQSDESDSTRRAERRLAALQ